MNLQDAEARQPGDRAEHDEDEYEAGRIEGRHQLAERQERADAVLADGERHRAEGADRRQPHDESDDVEERMRDVVDEMEHGLAALAQQRDREREQDREEQDLQDLSLGKSADDRVRDDVHQELDGALLARLRGVDLDRPGIDGLRIHVHADAGLQIIDDHQPDHEGEGGDDLEIDERLEADASDLLQVFHAGDAVHDGAEDDRRDQHLDQLDEAVAERLHLLADLRIEMPEQDADDDRGDHLDVEMHAGRPARGGRELARRHDVLPDIRST